MLVTQHKVRKDGVRRFRHSVLRAGRVRDPKTALVRLVQMNSLDWKEVEIGYRGKPVKGRYNVSDNLVTVAAWNGTKTARLGILPAERLAQMLLRQLADEGEEN